MKRWVRSEWWFEILESKRKPGNFKVLVHNLDGKDKELGRCLARVIELWMERESSHGAVPVVVEN